MWRELADDQLMVCCGVGSCADGVVQPDANLIEAPVVRFGIGEFAVCQGDPDDVGSVEVIADGVEPFGIKRRDDWRGGAAQCRPRITPGRCRELTVDAGERNPPGYVFAEAVGDSLGKAWPPFLSDGVIVNSTLVGDPAWLCPVVQGCPDAQPDGV